MKKQIAVRPYGLRRRATSSASAATDRSAADDLTRASTASAAKDRSATGDLTQASTARRFLSFSRRPPLSYRSISDPSPPARRAAVADGRGRAGPLPGNARMRRGAKPGGATAVAAVTVLTRAAPVGMGGDEPLLLRQRR